MFKKISKLFQVRPTPAHLTSVQAEQILAAACENESHNAKRMRLGLEPVSQPMPVIAGAEPRSTVVDHFSPANLTAEPKLIGHLANLGHMAQVTNSLAQVTNSSTNTTTNTSTNTNIIGALGINNNNNVAKTESAATYVKPTETLTKTVNASIGTLSAGTQFRAGVGGLFSPATHAQTFMSPAATLPLFHPHTPIHNGPQDLSMKPNRPLLPQKLTGPEVSAVRQLITGYSFFNDRGQLKSACAVGSVQGASAPYRISKWRRPVGEKEI
ncbi:unnamed protein product [Nesidiocoris tenuis]|uniref:Uncharacterized protein n=1 Tax=Nesidiocoris tenuis TaxID=355587 RepID=A0A6H5HV99_9HEMI|nr:unnamed protein product [Nesidiocoris tenuis]